MSTSTTPISDDPGGERALAGLADELGARFGDGVVGILMYGSCLRSGDPFDGLVDLYVVVDDYRVYRHRLLAAANRLLAPNVFYLETQIGGRTVRTKYGVISRAGLERAVDRAFEPYFWGRLTQPMAILRARSTADRASLLRALETARERFLGRTLPALPAQGSLDTLWSGALSLSYRTELRAERPERARELVAADAPFFNAIAEQWARRHPGRLHIEFHEGGLHYSTRIPRYRRHLAVAGWGLRRAWGKSLALARLTKALFTFDGGLDYLAWKLERHSGQKVEIPDRVRRRPLIHIWGLAWRLHRRGLFK